MTGLAGRLSGSVSCSANVEAEAAIAGIVSIDRRQGMNLRTTLPRRPVLVLICGVQRAPLARAMAVADPVIRNPAAPLVEAKAAAAVNLRPRAADEGVAHVVPMEPEGNAELDVALQTTLDSDTANELAAAVMIGEDNLPRTDDSSAEAPVRQTARPAVRPTRGAGRPPRNNQSGSPNPERLARAATGRSATAALNSSNSPHGWLRL